MEDTALTLRTMFPDLWYHMKNQRPDAAGTFAPFRFTFGARRSMFAPQLDDPITVEHLTLLVTGGLVFPADQQTIENALSIRKGSTTLHSPAAKAFAPGLASGAALMLTTRDPGSPGLASHPAIGATDEWTIEFGTEFFTPVPSQPSLVDRIADVMLIVTIEGGRA